MITPIMISLMAICLIQICRTDSYTKAVHFSLKRWKIQRKYGNDSAQPQAFPIRYDDGSIKWRHADGEITDRIIR